VNFLGLESHAEMVDYANAHYAAHNKQIAFKKLTDINLDLLADFSVDTLVALDINDQLEIQPDALHQFKQKLKPDGRMLIGISNKGDWQTWQQAIATTFIIEAAWNQEVPIDFKEISSKGNLTQLSKQEFGQAIECYRLYALSIDVQKLEQLPYINAYDKSNATLPLQFDFAKYYDNPWIVRLIININERLINEDVLYQYCMDNLGNARVGSADQGALLCIIAYHYLNHSSEIQQLIKLIEQIEQFDRHREQDNLHAYRWFINLHYVSGRLLLAHGNHKQALENLLVCNQIENHFLAPLLVIKAAAACLYAGLIYVSQGKKSLARDQFTLGIEIAKRSIQSDWQQIIGDFNDPIINIRDMVDMIHTAEQCARALEMIDQAQLVPGLFWQQINLRSFGFAEWRKQLEKENNLFQQFIKQLKLKKVNKKGE
jgi:hypothetical protein